MRARARTFIVAAALALGAGGAAAQSRSASGIELDTLIPVPEPAVEQPEIRLRFELLAELPLPGPLPGGGPRSAGDRIAIDVASGTALATWDGRLETAPLSEPASAEPVAPDEARVAYSPDGTFRCTPLETGWILGEQRCTSMGKLFSRRTWCRRWKIRAPGTSFARPLVTERHVYYGTTDNRVYCVKRGNGHRVWAGNVDGRVLRPLELLRIEMPAELALHGRRGERSMDLVLIVPDGGDAIVALDARSGALLASYELPENETLVGAPLAREGKIAVARQRYDERDAALLLLDLAVPRPVPGAPAPPGASPAPAP